MFTITSLLYFHYIFNNIVFEYLCSYTMLLQVPLVYFLLTELSLRLSDSNCFYKIINYTLKPLTMLEIYENTINETYV